MVIRIYHETDSEEPATFYLHEGDIFYNPDLKRYEIESYGELVAYIDANQILHKIGNETPLGKVAER